jgi:hypothetical protein
MIRGMVSYQDGIFAKAYRLTCKQFRLPYSLHGKLNTEIEEL